MWRNIGEIAGLIILLTIFYSCSTTRKSRPEVSRTDPGVNDMSVFGESVKALNINREGFVVRKADVELEGTEIEGRFSFYAKVNVRGDFFISVRGPLGLELVRALSSGDSVYVINKINRVVLFGSRDKLLKRAGLPENLIELITGDMPDSVSFSGAIITDNGLISLSYTDRRYTNTVTVSRESKKIAEEIIKTSEGETKYLLKFENFIESGSRRFASNVEIESVEKMFHVKINIQDLRPGFNDKIEIILPAYRREAL